MRPFVVVEADPISNHARSVLDAVEAVTMNALLLQRPDYTLHHAVLLRAVRGDELLLQAIAPDQCSEVAGGENQAVVRTQKKLLVHTAQSSKPADQGVFERTGCSGGLAGAGQMPTEQITRMTVDECGGSENDPGDRFPDARQRGPTVLAGPDTAEIS